MHTRNRGNIDRLVRVGSHITCLPLMYFLPIHYMMYVLNISPKHMTLIYCRMLALVHDHAYGMLLLIVSYRTCRTSSIEKMHKVHE